jgi:transcriptional regulator GlxA family with amidase domain
MSSAQKNDAGLVAAVVYEDLSLFEYGCAVEVFSLPRPELGAGWYRFTTVACTRGPLRGAGGIQIVADGDLKLFDEAKTILCLAGAMSRRPSRRIYAKLYIEPASVAPGSCRFALVLSY